MNLKSVVMFIFALQIIGKVIYFKRHELYGEIIKSVLTSVECSNLHMYLIVFMMATQGGHLVLPFCLCLKYLRVVFSVISYY